MIRLLDSLVRSNLLVYLLVRRGAIYFCRYFLLEEGFSFLRFVEPNPSYAAIDIGSNDGTSIEMIRQVHPNQMIHSFDPVRSPLKEYQNFHYHRVAISDHEGNLKINIPKVGNMIFTQYSSSDKEKVISQLMGDFDLSSSEISFSTIESKCLKLDSFDLKPYFIKIDVEGGEVSVLRGSKEIIKRFSPVVLIEIQSFENYSTILNFMEALNYFNLKWPQKSRLKDYKDIGTYTRKRNNYLWIPKHIPNSWKLKQLN
jgi:FkbM family methyltransferase